MQIASDLKAEAFKLEQQTQTGAPGMGGNRLTDAGKDLLELSAEESRQSQQRMIWTKAPGRNCKAAKPITRRSLALPTTTSDCCAPSDRIFLRRRNSLRWLRSGIRSKMALDYNLGLAYYKSQSYKQAAPPLENELKAHPGEPPRRDVVGHDSVQVGELRQSF